MKEILLLNAVSAGSDVTSNAVQLGDLRDLSVHIDFSGSDLAGTLTLIASNDDSDFVTVTGSSQAVTGAASHMYNVTNATYKSFKVFWDYTSGTGNITARVVIKENPIKGA